MKKLASILLAVIMIAAAIPLGAITAAADEPTQYHAIDVGPGAYIDTGFTPNKDTRIVMDVEMDNQWAGLFGFIYWWQTPQFFYVNSSGRDFGSGYGHNNSWANAGSPGRHTVELDKNVFKVDGVTKYTHAYTDFYAQSMYLFAMHTDDHAEYGDTQKIRFYSCQIYDNGTLVRDFRPVCWNGVSLYDRQNGKVYEFLGNNNVIPVGEPVNSLSSRQTGVMLDFDGKVTVSGNVEITGRRGESAIAVGKGKNVTIEIKKGATLKVKGGDADWRLGGGAGIEVPEGSTLEIIGEGNLDVTGGNASAGRNGEAGGDAYIELDDDRAYYGYADTGRGGRGGNGGGGAGAGIGGRGGNGGFGGAGAPSSSYYTERINYSGNDGSDGAPGMAGTNSGKVNICKTATVVQIKAGAESTAVAAGGAEGKNFQHTWTWAYNALGGGGGGGGGSGYGAENVGAGGAGGGGGGGGGSGVLIHRWYTSDSLKAKGAGHGGAGGIGRACGNTGSGVINESDTEGMTAGAGGKGGSDGYGNESADAYKPSYILQGTNDGGNGEVVGNTSVLRYYTLTAKIPQVNSFVYDGKEHTGVEEAGSYTITGNKAKVAGTYTAKLTLKQGYVWSDNTTAEKTFQWKIEKQPVPVPEVVSFCYTGNEQIAYTNQTLYNVQNGKATAIGDHEATFTIKDKTNYKWDAEGKDTGVYKLKFNIHPFTDKNGDGVCENCGQKVCYLYDTVPYLKKTVNSDNTVTTEEKTCAVARRITADDTEWGVEGQTSWCVADSDITLKNRPVIKGNVHIILVNGKTLTADHGITVEDPNTVSFYAQSDDKNTAGTLKIATNKQTAIGGHNGKDGAEGKWINGSRGGEGGHGEAGGNAGKMYFHGGNYDLASEGAVCIGGGIGGNGHIGQPKADDGFNAGNGGNGGNGGNANSVYFYGGDVKVRSDIACFGGGLAGNGNNGGNGPADGGDGVWFAGYYLIPNHGNGGKGGKGGDASDVYFYAGTVSAESDGACVSGGNGGNGGNGSPSGIKDLYGNPSRGGRCGVAGFGGNSGRLFFYGGTNTFTSKNGALFGVGIGGKAGNGCTGTADDGDNGTLADSSVTVIGNGVMQSGENAQKASKVTAYDGQQPYLSVVYPDGNGIDLGSALSEGNLWIVIAVAAAAVLGVAALVIVKKKKKKAEN